MLGVHLGVGAPSYSKEGWGHDNFVSPSALMFSADTLTGLTCLPMRPQLVVDGWDSQQCFVVHTDVVHRVHDRCCLERWAWGRGGSLAWVCVSKRAAAALLSAAEAPPSLLVMTVVGASPDGAWVGAADPGMVSLWCH
jgi:hypothetical protein